MTYYPEKITDTSGDLIIKAAELRGIKVLRFPKADPHMVMLEHGDHHEPLYYSRTNRQGSVAVKLTDNKAVTTALLRHGGFPVPEEIVTSDITEAAAFLEQYGTIVVKPLGSTGGTGVTPGITTREQLERAVPRARAVNIVKNVRDLFVVQQYFEGNDYRVLVIDQQHLFCINRISARVVGDGKQTITQLVASANTIRKANTYIHLDKEVAHELLAEQNVTEASIPSPGQVIRLERVANYHAGGNLHDATSILHPTVQETARAIAHYFNLGIIGIDCISPDISQEIGVIIELNGTPAITIHHFPDQGQPYDVASAIIDMLFPETKSETV